MAEVMDNRNTKIHMVDVQSQYLKIKEEVDAEIQKVIGSGAFINGPAVKEFAGSLKDYLDTEIVIPCANGTDALQIALMALDLKPGDEVIVPAFTYVATAEVIALMNLTPIMVDVDPDSFNITAPKMKGDPFPCCPFPLPNYTWANVVVQFPYCKRGGIIFSRF